MCAKSDSEIFVGTAGWALRAETVTLFGGGPSHLARYATRFNAVEINSSFYRPHKPATYARWAESVPENFRFAVKIPRQITHEQRLRDTDDALNAFLAQVGALGNRLGPLLVQLPPSLAFNAELANTFFDRLRRGFGGLVAIEPRHPSWFGADVEDALRHFKIARVAADPAPVKAAALPAGWPELVYVRLHGSPRMYYSRYQKSYLDVLANRLRAMYGAQRWCIFDNTASGEATANALALKRLIA